MACAWPNFLILTNLLCGFVVAFDNTFCDNRDVGYYADEENCANYYHCDESHTTFHQTCSLGTVWRNNICDSGSCETHPTPSSISITPVPPSSTTTLQPMVSPNPNGTMFLLSVKDSVPVQPSFMSLYLTSTSTCALYCFSYSVCVRFSVYQQTCDLFQPPTDPNDTMTTLSGSETWCKYPCYKL